jgi:glycosyltransferase involved in cell wall biosynthesis
MNSVTFGIHVHAEPVRLIQTLNALANGGRHPFRVLLLPDGPDAATRATLATLDLPRSMTSEALGPPACFNRLAAETDSDIVIMLESGAIPVADALDRVIDALLADPCHGLAGPSTNLAWNEQGVFPYGREDPVSLAQVGHTAAMRFGKRVALLTPLHSLSDFCYAVRREVIEAIGGADEGYELGPCWEMEYNVRAARAGFQGIWVCGAYVYRPPFTERRQTEEARRFEASRRRYQDSLCALRLNGQRYDYEPHCRGEACEHFAPAGLMQVRRALRDQGNKIGGAALRPSASARSQSRGLPLVSCIMPTRNRADLVLHTIELFRRQDYEPRELVIVDDGDDDLQARLPDESAIRYVRSPAGESIGAKRNRACAAARGAFVVQWDDDDWYGPRRLTMQLAPLIAGRAQITALRAPIFFELGEWRFWAVSDALHRRLFVEDVHGGTLAFSRGVWERLAQYPQASLAEDAAFLVRAKARGARLERLSSDGQFIYIRHPGNAWRFPCGTYLDPRGWRQMPEPSLDPRDRAFYAALSRHAPATESGPLVSAIMPTADRRRFVTRAIKYFQRQDYPNRELLILDDGEDRVADLVPPDPRIRYVSLESRLVLGDKRNRACELARGELVAHWDDDDWQAPYRLRYQVEQLEQHGAALCGPRRVVYVDPPAKRAWLYDYPEAARSWVAGNALLYRRSVWQENRFPAVGIGEDTRFLWELRRLRPLVLADHRFFAAIIHPRNTSRKLTTGAFWHPLPVEEVRRLLGSDWQHYTDTGT